MDDNTISNAGRWMLNRRDFLRHGGTGLSAVALLSLLGGQKLLGDKTPLQWSSEKPFAPRPPHFKPKAKNVVVIFCSGALSHLDAWDYKPELIKHHDKPMPGSSGLVTFQGENGNLIKPLWEFRPRGQSGKMISDLLPNLAELADDFCFIHSMTAKSNTHGPAENQMSTGFILDGFPSMGAWATYALGSENQNLPAFVAIPDPRGVPQVGPNHWSAGFLPAVFQGTAFNAEKGIPNLDTPKEISPLGEKNTRDFLKFLNDRHLAQHPGDSDLSARIASYELAAKMQLSAPEVADFKKESSATLEMYGVNDSNKVKAGFARNCVLARRLIERGVRFVQLFNGAYA
ncbi:MAG: DUF1501 domain-containing protein, partial [Verrucomicrobiota bacterium]